MSNYEDEMNNILFDGFDEDTEKSRKDKQWKIIVAIVAVAAILVSSIIFIAWKAYNSNNESPKVNDSASERIIDVSSETESRMGEGTILTFGSSDPQAKKITIFASPKDLSRDGRVVSGKPSDLLNAVKDKKITLNLYLEPSSDEDSKGTDSMIKSASCRIVQDKSPGAIYTLSGIVSASGNFVGNESTVDIAKKMNMKSDTKCPKTSGDAASSTANNAMHFKTQYKLSKPELIVSGGAGITEFSRLSDNWVEKALDGKPANDFISSN